MEAKVFTNARAQRLPYRAVIPSKPVASIVFHHGFGEHSGVYDYLLKYFSKLGIAAYTYDCMGHGKADGDNGKMHYL